MLEVPNGLSRRARRPDRAAGGGRARGGQGRSRPPSTRCMVVGCGPVGLAVIASLKARGLGPIVGRRLFSPSGGRRPSAWAPTSSSIRPQVSPHDSWAEMGVPAHPRRGGDRRGAGQGGQAPLIFECVGAPGVLQSPGHGRAGRRAGSSSPACAWRPTPSSPWPSSKEIELRFVLGYTAEEFAASLSNLAEGKTRLRRGDHRRGRPRRDPRRLQPPADRQEPDQDPGRAGR